MAEPDINAEARRIGREIKERLLQVSEKMKEGSKFGMVTSFNLNPFTGELSDFSVKVPIKLDN